MKKEFQHAKRREEIQYPYFALYLDGLRRLYCTEGQILGALPKFIALADSQELRDALAVRTEQTAIQLKRLDEVFQILQRSKDGLLCKPMAALLDDGLEQANHFVAGPVRDTAIVAGNRAAGCYADLHYRISQLAAEHLGETETVKLLGETLASNARFEERLCDLSKSAVLLRAVDVFHDPVTPDPDP